MTERLDVLEGRVEEQSKNWDRVYAQIGQVLVSVDQRFAKVDERFAKIDERFAKIDERFDQVDERFDQIDRRIDRVELRIDTLDNKLDRKFDDLRSEMWKQFRWTMGVMITLLGTMLTLGAGVITALLTRTPS